MFFWFAVAAYEPRAAVALPTLPHARTFLQDPAPARESGVRRRQSPSTRPANQRGARKPSDGADIPSRLRAAVEDAKTPDERLAAATHAAQHAIIREAAAHLSQVLSGRPAQPDDPPDCLRRADGLLRIASESLSKITNQPGGRRSVEYRDRLEMLTAFHRLFTALATAPADDDTAARELLSACSRLAVFLDDSNSGVVESARLWLGAAYRRAGRPDRAIQILRPTLTPPADPRLGLHARLQRSLALGDAGLHAAGLSLCLKLDARVGRWFADEATADEARRLVRRTRIQLLRSWAATLRTANAASQAREAEARADALGAEGDATARPADVLRLEVTVSGLPEWSDETIGPRDGGDRPTDSKRNSETVGP